MSGQVSSTNFGPYWSRLDCALGFQGFVGFLLSSLNGQDLAALEKAAASTERIFAEVVEQREWGIIRERLGRLAASAQYIALRAKSDDLDIVIGRLPHQLDVKAEKEYVSVVARLLMSMSAAAQTLKLSEGAVKAAEQALNQAEKVLSTQPALIPAVEGFRLMLPFVRFRGHFRCVIVVDATKVSEETAKAWRNACLRDVASDPGILHFVRAGVQSWLWDVDTDKVYDTDADCEWHEGILNVNRVEIPDLDKAEQLAANLRAC